MYLRISKVFGAGLLSLALSSCGHDGTDHASSEEAIECAIGEGAQWTKDCYVAPMVQTNQFIIQHPDGGFRRLQIVSDGRGVVAADGAEEAQVKILPDSRIEVKLGQDRYRLPATQKTAAQ